MNKLRQISLGIELLTYPSSKIEVYDDIMIVSLEETIPNYDIFILESNSWIPEENQNYKRWYYEV